MEIYLSQVREQFINKVNSKLEVVQRGYFEDEVFGNSGSIPPQVGEITTYTIMWQVKNYYSEIKNAKVKATLPKNVRLTGKIFPEEEADKFTFDLISRELIWNIGDLMVAQGILNPAPNIVFQISFTPEANQKGQKSNLIEEVRITGEDQWTKETLEAANYAIDTTLPDDQTITSEMGVIQ